MHIKAKFMDNKSFHNKQPSFLCTKFQIPWLQMHRKANSQDCKEWLAFNSHQDINFEILDFKCTWRQMHNIATNNVSTKAAFLCTRFPCVLWPRLGFENQKWSKSWTFRPSSVFSFKKLSILELTFNSMGLFVHHEPVPYNFPSVVLHSNQ